MRSAGPPARPGSAPRSAPAVWRRRSLPHGERADLLSAGGLDVAGLVRGRAGGVAAGLNSAEAAGQPAVGGRRQARQSGRNTQPAGFDAAGPSGFERVGDHRGHPRRRHRPGEPPVVGHAAGAQESRCPPRPATPWSPRLPSGRSSSASNGANASSAALPAEYALSPGTPTAPAIELTNTIAAPDGESPGRLEGGHGRAGEQQRCPDVEVEQFGQRRRGHGREIPGVPDAGVGDDRVEPSVRSPAQPPPPARRSPARAGRPPPSRPDRARTVRHGRRPTTRAPRRVSSSAVARPMPRLAPVTSTTDPASSTVSRPVSRPWPDGWRCRARSGNGPTGPHPG